jgi:hypothetical protein
VGEIKNSDWSTISTSLPLKLLRFLQINLRDSSTLLNLYPEQFSYGHREILLDECGLDYSTQLIGNLQHGFWDINTYDFRSPRFIGGKSTSTWVFSKDLENIGRQMGFRKVHAIGAPWMYLKKRLEEKKVQQPLMGKKVLVMPGHSQSNFYDRSSKEMILRRASLFREVAGNLEATVCLHPIDFLNSFTRIAFIEQGFEVTCLGLSNLSPVWSPAADRVKFLENLFYLMSEHSHYITDDVGTSMFYALNMRLNVAVFPTIRRELDTASINSGEVHNGEYLNWSERYLEDNFPEVLNQYGSNENSNNFADILLGIDCLKDKDELLEILDYRKDIYTDFKNYRKQ